MATAEELIEAVARAAAVQMTSLQGSERNMDADLTPNERKFYLPIARAAIAAIEAAGYRIVPVVATEDMQYAGYDTHYDVSDGGDWAPIEQWREIANAIIAAAPKVIG